MDFCVRKISEYRTEMMGVATILVFVVHSYDNGVVMPGYIRTVCALGSLGVDIFLLVSGLGLWYSLDKLSNSVGNRMGGAWYITRYKRILIPWVIITLPIALIEIYEGKAVTTVLLNFSTLNYWLNHKGPWYVAMLIPLYAITPLHFQICGKLKKPIYYNLFIIIILTILVTLPISSPETRIDNLIGNIRHVLYRLPVFFVGFILAPLSKENNKVSFLWMVIMPLAVVVAMKLLHFGYWPGFLVLPLIYTLCYLFDLLGSERLSFFRFYGKISLESYLLNGTTAFLIIRFLPSLYNSPLNKGCYLFYALVVILGTILSVIVNYWCPINN